MARAWSNPYREEVKGRDDGVFCACGKSLGSTPACRNRLHCQMRICGRLITLGCSACHCRIAMRARTSQLLVGMSADAGRIGHCEGPVSGAVPCVVEDQPAN